MGGELFTLFAKLMLDTSEFDKNTDQSKHKISMFGDMLKADLAGKAITAAVDGLKKLGGAVVNLTKSSVAAYSDYQQLSGGIQKLFGTAGQTLEEYAAQQGQTVDEARDKFEQLTEAQNLVAQNAAGAYRTAGMSANEYMEKVSGFSAALINSLGGDTVEAAKRADVAMSAISDNVNTFGTDMESVQNAFQGFAKQNYTMLDNLKLGYGGTKTEMERLIEDANEYAKSLDMAGDLSIDSFADVVTAIDLIQQKQNIAGTTSREAASTIEGSLNMVKGAWTNLVAGFANPDADIGKLIGEVVDSAGTALKNLMPAVTEAIKGVGKAFSEFAPIIIDELPNIISEVAPALLESVSSLFTSVSESLGEFLPIIFDGLMEAIPDQMDNLTDIVIQIGEYLSNAFPMLAEKGGELLQTLAQGILDNAPRLIEAGANMIRTLAQGLVTGIPNFLANALPMLLQFSETLKNGASTLIDSGIQLILDLVQGLMDGLPTMLEYLPDIITNIANIINENAPKLLVAGVQLIVTIGKGIINAIPALIENFPKILRAIVAVWSAMNWMDLGRKAIKLLGNGIKALANDAPAAIKNIGKKAYDFFKGINWSELGRNVINKIASAIRYMIATVPGLLLQVGQDAWNKFKEIDWYDLGSKVIEGIVKGIKAGIQWIKDAAAEAANAGFQKAKDILGIKSPSRVFRDQVGKMIPRGIALGITDDEKYVDTSMDRLGNRLLRDFDSLTLPTIAPIETIAVERSETPENGRVIYITNNITVDGAESPEDYADRLVREMELQVRTA